MFFETNTPVSSSLSTWAGTYNTTVLTIASCTNPQGNTTITIEGNNVQLRLVYICVGDAEIKTTGVKFTCCSAESNNLMCNSATTGVSLHNGNILLSNVNLDTTLRAIMSISAVMNKLYDVIIEELDKYFHLGPTLSINTVSHDFGGVKIGMSSDKAIQKSNTGNAQLTGLNISALSGEFTRITTCTSTLAAGSKYNVTVTFLPNSVGAKSAANDITTTSAGNK